MSLPDIGQKYGKDSFQPIHTPEEGEEYMLKPMNCPHHCEIYKSSPRSYRDLRCVLRSLAVYRYEQSGEPTALTRESEALPGMTLHIFCAADQIKGEFLKVMDIILYIFKAPRLQEL